MTRSFVATNKCFPTVGDVPVPVRAVAGSKCLCGNKDFWWAVDELFTTSDKNSSTDSIFQIKSFPVKSELSNRFSVRQQRERDREREREREVENCNSHLGSSAVLAGLDKAEYGGPAQVGPVPAG